ncbi:ABC transporter ATP-binding protein [Paracoccus sp. (in: a-proteobacteria)]|uniref:ABC transporter ATP-binding protein n=1 Tax=Paracoccus sp. TaxID=267 RepID=UPI0028B1CA54|nr:ABC transporter ATP-binding protein [Paracoccus sp. (in: a-proteobacteria)]
MSEILTVENLTCGYDGKIAINKIDMRVEPGSLTALLGANGAGKSTLMKAVAGLISPFSGRITYGGQVISGVDTRKLVKMGISYVPEGRAIARSLTVRENLILGGITRSKANNAQQIEAVLALFPEVAERLTSPAWQLSGGQQQMLAIGRALMSNPRLLLLDEPSLGLAPLLVRRVFNRLEELRRGGLTILLVEQNYWLTMKIADCAYFMRAGHVIGRKDATEMRAAQSVDDILSAYLGYQKKDTGAA